MSMRVRSAIEGFGLLPPSSLCQAEVGRVLPTCLALVLCRRVRRLASGEPVIEEAFEFFEAESLPSDTRPFVVWMQFRDGNGATHMALVAEYLPPNELEPELLVSARFSLHFANPHQVLEHEAAFETGLAVDWEGRYRLRVTADGISIAQRDFTVFGSSA